MSFFLGSKYLLRAAVLASVLTAIAAGGLGAQPFGGARPDHHLHTAALQRSGECAHYLIGTSRALVHNDSLAVVERVHVDPAHQGFVRRALVQAGLGDKLTDARVAELLSRKVLHEGSIGQLWRDALSDPKSGLFDSLSTLLRDGPLTTTSAQLRRMQLILMGSSSKLRPKLNEAIIRDLRAASDRTMQELLDGSRDLSGVAVLGDGPIGVSVAHEAIERGAPATILGAHYGGGVYDALQGFNLNSVRAQVALAGSPAAASPVRIEDLGIGPFPSAEEYGLVARLGLLETVRKARKTGNTGGLIGDAWIEGLRPGKNGSVVLSGTWKGRKVELPVPRLVVATGTGDLPKLPGDEVTQGLYSESTRLLEQEKPDLRAAKLVTPDGLLRAIKAAKPNGLSEREATQQFLKGVDTLTVAGGGHSAAMTLELVQRAYGGRYQGPKIRWVGYDEKAMTGFGERYRRLEDFVNSDHVEIVRGRVQGTTEQRGSRKIGTTVTGGANIYGDKAVYAFGSTSRNAELFESLVGPDYALRPVSHGRRPYAMQLHDAEGRPWPLWVQGIASGVHDLPAYQGRVGPGKDESFLNFYYEQGRTLGASLADEMRPNN